jgi:hypothetical protein
MRLIDADRAMEIVRDQGIAHPNAYHLTNYATLILREAPTVDAVEVVRCRKCKYHDEERIEMVYCPNMIGGWVENEWFCANGKRKEGAE